jgi:hypothetical protein
VNSHSARFAKGLPRQPALFKIPYQAFGLSPAPAPSPNNFSRIFHAPTSTHHRHSQKGGFARMDTFVPLPVFFPEFQPELSP